MRKRLLKKLSGNLLNQIVFGVGGSDIYFNESRFSNCYMFKKFRFSYTSRTINNIEIPVGSETKIS
jgi:hypothetical protein